MPTGDWVSQPTYLLDPAPHIPNFIIDSGLILCEVSEFATFLPNLARHRHLSKWHLSVEKQFSGLTEVNLKDTHQHPTHCFIRTIACIGDRAVAVR